MSLSVNKLRKADSGYTLAEIMTVVVILGVLAALALPNYNIQVKKVKNQEAVQVLLAFYGTQTEFAREHDNGDDVPDYADDPEDEELDVKIDDQQMRNFKFNPAFSGTVSCVGDVRYYAASLQSMDGSYILYALDDAMIVCTDGDGNCPAELCTKMGFKEF